MTRRREEEIRKEAITHTGGGSVPCRRTPPFFLKRGLPDHSGGLEGEREHGQQPIRRLHREAESKAAI